MLQNVRGEMEEILEALKTEEMDAMDDLNSTDVKEI